MVIILRKKSMHPGEDLEVRHRSNAGENAYSFYVRKQNIWEKIGFGADGVLFDEFSLPTDLTTVKFKVCLIASITVFCADAVVGKIN